MFHTGGMPNIIPPHIVARQIQRVQLTYAGAMLGVLGLYSDEVYRQMLVEGIDKDPRLLPLRKDGSAYQGLDAPRSRDFIKRDPEFAKEAAATTLMPLVSWVGDMVKACKDGASQPDKALYQTPELEFLRHLRNAMSHGNRFEIRGSEPVLPAQFKTFSINSALHGTTMVMFDWIGAGDIFDLFDHLASYLHTLP